RPRDHVLPAAAPDLGALPAGRAPRPRGSRGSAGRLRSRVQRSHRCARDRPRPAPCRRAAIRRDRVTDLAALAAELLPGATWVGPEGRGAAAGGRGRAIAWVRILRARVPAFDALDAGDLVIAPAS